MQYYYNLGIRLFLMFFVVLDPWNIFYHLLLAPTLHLTKFFFSEGVIEGTSFLIQGYALNFIPACIATIAYILLALLILSTKDLSWKQRTAMFLTGSIMIFIANMLRIWVLLHFLLTYGYETFSLWHLFIWHGVSSIFVALTWIVLVRLYHVKSIPAYDDLKELNSKRTKNI